MYLMAQLWFLLLIAFLLGALCGCLIWRACGVRRIAADYERARQGLMVRAEEKLKDVHKT